MLFNMIYTCRSCSWIDIICCSWNCIPINQSQPFYFTARVMAMIGWSSNRKRCQYRNLTLCKSCSAGLTLKTNAVNICQNRVINGSLRPGAFNLASANVSKGKYLAFHVFKNSFYYFKNSFTSHLIFGFSFCFSPIHLYQNKQKGILYIYIYTSIIPQESMSNYTHTSNVPI